MAAKKTKKTADATGRKPAKTDKTRSKPAKKRPASSKTKRKAPSTSGARAKKRGKSKAQPPSEPQTEAMPTFAVAFIDSDGKEHVAGAEAPDPGTAVSGLLDQASSHGEPWVDDLVAVIVSHPATWESVRELILAVFED